MTNGSESSPTISSDQYYRCSENGMQTVIDLFRSIHDATPEPDRQEALSRALTTHEYDNQFALMGLARMMQDSDSLSPEALLLALGHHEVSRLEVFAAASRLCPVAVLGNQGLAIVDKLRSLLAKAPKDMIACR
jgi:hypothetical protein